MCHVSLVTCHVSHVTCHVSCVMCHVLCVICYIYIFYKVAELVGGGFVINKASYSSFSKHRPSGPMLSISRNVHMCVCLFVCLSVCSLLRHRLTVFLPPLPEVGCPIFLETRNPWGKVMERSGLRFEHFCL